MKKFKFVFPFYMEVIPQKEFSEVENGWLITAHLLY